MSRIFGRHSFYVASAVFVVSLSVILLNSTEVSLKAIPRVKNLCYHNRSEKLSEFQNDSAKYETNSSYASKYDPRAQRFNKKNKTLINMLDNSCGPASPRFLSFAWTHVGRWSKADIVVSAKLMYSSLARAHHCAPIVYMYTNDKEIRDEVSTIKSTMNTRTNFIVIVSDLASIPTQGYDKWRDLSRYKLDVFIEHIQRGERLIWSDIDTIVLADLTKVMERNISWGVGWARGSLAMGKQWSRRAFSGLRVKPKNVIMGDLWTLNLQGVEDVLSLEKRQKENNITKPQYDLQGYFSILASTGWPSFKIIQDLMPDYSFGFQCSGYKFPERRHFNPVVRNGDLICPDKDNIGLGVKVGAMSFTAPTLKQTLLDDPVNFSCVANQDAREWLLKWFYL